MSEPSENPPDGLWQEVTRMPRRLASAPKRRRSRGSGIWAAAVVVGAMMAGIVGFVYWENRSGGEAQNVAAAGEEPNPSGGADSRPAPDKEPAEDRQPAAVRDVPVAASDVTPAPRPKPKTRPRRDTSPMPEPSRIPAASVPRAMPPSVEPLRSNADEGKPRERASTAEKPSGANGSDPSAVDPAASPQNRTEFGRAVRRAQEAFAARDLDEAGRQLDAAEKHASSPAEQDKVRQLRALGKQLALFLKAVAGGLKKYQPTEEITIGSVVAAIIEIQPDRVTLFIEGKRREYTITTMPARLSLFFARSAADEDSPAGAVFFGAFYAIEGDRGRARAMWEAAAAAGATVDDLLPLVAGAPLVKKRQAVPDATELAAARQVLQEQFAEAIVTAKTPAEKAQLAANLLVAARQTDNAAEQYAALEQARDWAVSASDPATALEALDMLAGSFDVDVLEHKAKALGASIAGRVSLESAAAAADAAIALSAEAERTGRAELAASLADTAYTAARKSRDSALIKRAYARRRETQAAEKESGKSKAARSNR